MDYLDCTARDMDASAVVHMRNDLRVGDVIDNDVFVDNGFYSGFWWTSTEFDAGGSLAFYLDF